MQISEYYLISSRANTIGQRQVSQESVDVVYETFYARKLCRFSVKEYNVIPNNMSSMQLIVAKNAIFQTIVNLWINADLVPRIANLPIFIVKKYSPSTPEDK
uniref:Uncharacterized protein n=1 Tax=Romanomermis culicivorax TaxID=13658 RepID=A0A915J0P6_ROMCU